MARDIIDSELAKQAQDQLNIKRVRVSERLIYDYQNYLFQEFGDKYSRLIEAYNRGQSGRTILADPQEILRMSSSEILFYQMVSIKHDRSEVAKLYQTQFRAASEGSLIRFMALYDATKESEESLVSNQLARLNEGLKGLNTTVKQMKIGTDNMDNTLAGVLESTAWLSADKLAMVSSYNPEKYVETLHEKSVQDIHNALVAYGREYVEQQQQINKQNLRGGR